jgi:dephospho-CoA kinase
MLRVGLTGGIACGKSEVLRLLGQSGLPTLDLDQVAHELMAPGQPVHDEVIAAFGPGVRSRDGSVDRRALGAIVFSDSQARARLNAIVHPAVRAEEARREAQVEAAGEVAMVTDAALLVETGVHLRFDRLVVVHCRPEQQRERLRARSGLSDTEARARILAQMPLREKLRFGHFQVDTSGSLEDTRRGTREVLRQLREAARTRPKPLRIARGRILCALEEGPQVGPRGLTPLRVATDVAAAGGLEMERLARLLDPPPEGPWYSAPVASAPDRGMDARPASLLVPVVLWELGRKGHDPQRLAAAAHSLAWLTHRKPEALAAACLFALILGDVFALGHLPTDLIERSRGWAPLAKRWGGASGDAFVAPILSSALAEPSRPEAARDRCAALGGEGGLAGALVGFATGVTADDRAASRWQSFLRALETLT